MKRSIVLLTGKKPGNHHPLERTLMELGFEVKAKHNQGSRVVAIANDTAADLVLIEPDPRRTPKAVEMLREELNIPVLLIGNKGPRPKKGSRIQLVPENWSKEQLFLGINMCLEKHSYEQKLKNRIKFERLINSIAADFVNIEVDEIDDRMNTALRQLGQFKNVDRCYFALFCDDFKKFSVSHEWHISETQAFKPLLQNVPLAPFPAFLEIIKSGRIFEYDFPEEYPAKGKAEEEMLVSMGVQSGLIIPVISNKKAIGKLSFHSNNDVLHFTEDDKQLVITAAQIFANVLKRRDAELAKREAESHFKSLTQHSSDILSTLDLEGNFTYISDNAERIMGYAPDSLIGTRGFDTIHPDDHEIVWSIIKQVMSHPGEAFTEKCRYKFKDGEYYLMETSGRLVSEKEKTPYIILNTRDISESEKVKEDLEENKTHLYQAQKMGKIGTFEWYVQEDRSILSDNFYEMLGLDKSIKEFNFEKWDQLVHPDDVAYTHQVMEEAILEQKPIDFTYRVFHSNGEMFYFNSRGTILYDDAGNAELIKGYVIDVTDKMISQNEIEKSELKFREVFEQGVMGMSFVSKEFGIIDANQKHCDILGYSREELLKLSFVDYTHPDDIAIDVEKTTAVFEGKLDEFTLEKRIIQKSGKLIWVKIHVTSLKDDDGEIRHILTVMEDITERKIADDKLVKNKTILEKAQEIAQMGSWEFEIENRKLTWSREMKRIYGVESDDFVFGLDMLYAFLHPDDQKKVKNNIEQILKRKGTEPIEYRIIRKDGSERVIAARGGFIYSEAGEKTGMVGSIIDITDARLAEKELKESEERYRKLVEHNPAGIAVHVNGIIEYINPRACEIMGVKSEKDLVGHSALEMVHPDYHETVKHRIKGLLEGDDLAKPVEEKFIRHDGSILDVAIAGFRFMYKGQLGVQVVFWDITERKQAEKALKENELKWSSLFNNSRELISVLDLELIILSFNHLPQGSLDKGMLLKDVIGSCVLDYIDEDDLAEFVKAIEKIKITGSPQRIQYKTNISGTKYEAIVTPLMKDEKVDGYIFISTDVTEKLNQELAIKNSERKYRNLVEKMNDGLIMQDQKDRIIFANEKVTEITGLEMKELIGINLMDLVVGNNSLQTYQNQMRDRSDGRTGNYQLKIRNHQGKDVDILVTASPMQDERGKFLGSMGIIRDVTKEKKAIEEIRNLAKFPEENPNIVIRVNEKGEIVHLNPAAESLLPNNDSKRIACIQDILSKSCQSILSENEKFTREWQLENTHFLFYISPIEEGHYINLYGVDITEQHNLNLDLNRSLEEKEVLLKEVHHRVKNNLQIISSLFMLQMEELEDEKSRSIFQSNLDRIKALALVHEKLYQSRNMANIDMAKYLEDLMAHMVASQFQYHRNINIDLQCDPIHLGIQQALPCGMIINELVSNSLKYAFPEMNEGTIVVEMKRSEKDDGILKLNIADNGVGLPEGFEPEESITLGYTLISSLVGQLKGEYKLVSKNGTSVEISFPEGKKKTILQTR